MTFFYRYNKLGIFSFYNQKRLVFQTLYFILRNSFVDSFKNISFYLFVFEPIYLATKNRNLVRINKIGFLHAPFGYFCTVGCSDVV